MIYLTRRVCLRWATGCIGGLTGLSLCLFIYFYMQSLERSGKPVSNYGTVATRDWPEPARITREEWTVLQPGGGWASAPTGPLAERYRLAGTFFAFPEPGQPIEQASRRAILDDLSERKQHLLQEGDTVNAVDVVGIFQDRIVLRSAGREESLWLSFKGTGSTGSPSTPHTTGAGEAAVLRFEDMPALETNRFGKRIGENRWLFDRIALMDYYHELMEDPERLTSILMAMQPVYDEGEDTGIGGFTLDMLGENILYEAAGFQNGDVVRMVNSMPMVSGARAGFFISEFVNERMSAVVLDIERNGKAEKLIYLIR